jgi:NAD(P)-dependent dehydrogenase (short-subunit alcohol dehydrogenase family)
MSLDGKVLLMCGAGPGVGRAIATLAASRGAALALLARTRATLQATASLASETQALCLTADVADPTAVRTAVDATLDRFGRIDVLVHSILPPHLLKQVLELDDVDLPAWQHSLMTSVFGAFPAARPSAMPRPMPRVAPVTSATLPERLNRSMASPIHICERYFYFHTHAV